MKKWKYEFATSLEFSVPVTEHYFTLRCIPSSDEVQQVFSINCRVAPETNISYNIDCFGNKTCLGCITEPHTGFSFVSEGIVYTGEGKSSEKPKRIYRYPTELTAFSVQMKEYFGGEDDYLTDPVRYAVRISEKLFAYMQYRKGMTGIHTTAAQAFASGQGVCQDYSHILISVLRENGFMARYISGMMAGEGATHAWVEIYGNDGWTGFDPTNMCFADDRYIKLAKGRDYKDCIADRGVFRGSALQTQTVSVSVK